LYLGSIVEEVRREDKGSFSFLVSRFWLGVINCWIGLG
jgi:hypothetical protein